MPVINLIICPTPGKGNAAVPEAFLIHGRPDQSLDKRICRLPDDGLRVHLKKFSAIHDHDTVSQTEGLVYIVGDKKEGPSGLTVDAGAAHSAG